jgi:hypothetical protein
MMAKKIEQTIDEERQEEPSNTKHDMRNRLVLTIEFYAFHLAI